MEENFFPRPEVSGLLQKNVVEARLHTDRAGPFLNRILALQQRFSGSRALPVYVLLDPRTERSIGRVKGAREPAFLDLVRQAASTN